MPAFRGAPSFALSGNEVGIFHCASGNNAVKAGSLEPPQEESNAPPPIVPTPANAALDKKSLLFNEILLMTFLI
jgi:hypothetical protein